MMGNADVNNPFQLEFNTNELVTITNSIFDDFGNEGSLGGGIRKLGLGTLNLKGSNGYYAPTSLDGGTVSVTNDVNLGNSASSLKFNGGILQVTGTTFTSTPRTIIWGPNGGGFDINSVNNNFTVTQALSGSGGLIKKGSGILTLSGIKTYSGITQIDAGTLALPVGSSIAQSSEVRLVNGATFDIAAGNQTIKDLSGTGGIVNLGASTLSFGTSNSTTYAGIVQGSGGLIKQGSGTFTLVNANPYSGTTRINAGEILLQNAASAGSGPIINNSGLGLNFSNATFSNNLSSTGITSINGQNVRISGINNNFSGTWKINGTSSVAAPINLGTAIVSLPSNASQLSLRPVSGAGFKFENKLQGQGILSGIMGNSADEFKFGNNVENAFEGIVKLGTGIFDLSAGNTTVLRSATLQLDEGNKTTVGDGVQNIGPLTINGGTLVFNATVPADKLAASTIQTPQLNLTTGKVSVIIPNASQPPEDWSGPTSLNPLLQQDEITVVQLIKSTNITGAANNIELIDQNGLVVEPAEQVNLTKNNQVIAVGSYGYSLSTNGNTVNNGNNGLYVSYGLTKLNLQKNQSLLLSGDNNTSPGSELHALLTGIGDVIIDATKTITISNPNNDYTGTTTVNDDILILGSDNALGKTSALTINENSITNVNGKTQTVGFLETKGNLNIADGNFSISNGGKTAPNTLLGGGNLNLIGGNLKIQGANPLLTALPLIESAATATLTNVNGLGTNVIENEGNLTFDQTSGTFSNPLIGTGSLNLINNSKIIITDNKSYSGTTNIQSSHLILNTQIGNSPVQVSTGSRLSGNGTALSLVSSGTIATGNSIGTQRYINDLRFTPTNIYECEVDDAGHSDLIIVGGTATLDGTLQIIPMAGNYQNGNSYIYTLLTSGNLITTQFPTVTGLAALFGYQVTYRPNAVILEIIRKSFVSVE